MSREFEFWFTVYLWFTFWFTAIKLIVNVLIKGKPSKPKKYTNKYIEVYINRHIRIYKKRRHIYAYAHARVGFTKWFTY